jgi:hypothetical protein
MRIPQVVHDDQRKQADLPCLQDIRRQPKIHQGQMQMSTEEVTRRYEDDGILKNLDRQIAEIEIAVLSQHTARELLIPEVAMKVRKTIIEMQQPLIEAKAKYYATHIPQIVITKKA